MPTKPSIDKLLARKNKARESMKKIQQQISAAREKALLPIGKEISKHHSNGWKGFDLEKFKAFVSSKLG